jgi:uncharacterized membrane protein
MTYSSCLPVPVGFSVNSTALEALMTAMPELDLEARMARLEQAVFDIQQTIEQSSYPRARRERTTQPEPARIHAEASTARKQPVPQAAEFPSLEWLAARSAEWWVGSLGVVFLVIASFLLYRYAVDHEWITPLVRVLTGVTVGGGMLAAARRFTERDAACNEEALGLREILLGGGLAVWYLSSYAAAVFYQLISMPTARGCFLILSVVSAWLALKERRILFALIALCVGFAAPSLLPSPSQSLIGLALYLAPLSALGLVLYLMRGWELVLWTTFIGFWFDVIQVAFASLGIGAASVFTLLLIAAGVGFARAPILRRRLVALNVDRYGKAEAGARAAFWIITIASPMLMLSMLFAIWSHVASEFWGIAEIALALAAYRLSESDNESDPAVRHLEVTAAVVWSLAGIEWLAIAIAGRAGFAAGPLCLAVAAMHSAFVVLTLRGKDFTAPRAIAKATAVMVLVVVILFEVNAPNSGGMRMDWTFAEALVLGLTAWHWKSMRDESSPDMNATVFATIGYGALLLVLARVLGAIWLPLVTASYAIAGAALLIASREGEGRKFLLRLGGLTMVIVVGRLIIVDMSSVETIWRVLLFLACGFAFVGASYRMQPGRAIPSGGSNSA